jgi:hypothetical protein
MPVTDASGHFRDTLGELGQPYRREPLRPIRDPVEGWMHVVGCTAIEPGVTCAPCHITYVVQAEGTGIFSGDQTFELSSSHWPHPCDDLPVVFDRDRTENIQFQWERLPTHAEWARLHAEQLAHQFHSLTTAAPVMDRQDAITRLRQLSTLHARGMITPEEFIIAKRRIVDELTSPMR